MTRANLHILTSQWSIIWPCNEKGTHILCKSKGRNYIGKWTELAEIARRQKKATSAEGWEKTSEIEHQAQWKGHNCRVRQQNEQSLQTGQNVQCAEYKTWANTDTCNKTRTICWKASLRQTALEWQQCSLQRPEGMGKALPVLPGLFLSLKYLRHFPLLWLQFKNTDGKQLEL